MFNLNFDLVLLSISALGVLFISFLIFFKSKKEHWDKKFILLNVALLFWIVSDIFYSLSETNVYMWAVATYSVALFLPFLYLIFSRDFLSSRKDGRVAFLLSLAPFLLLLFLILRPGWMIKGGNQPFAYGYLYFFYLAYMLGYFLIGHIFFLKKFFNYAGKNIEQQQIKFIFWGSVVASVAACAGALILPLFNIYSLYFISPSFTLVLSIFIAYAIFKHNLFNIKVIATEVFAGALILTFLIRSLISENITDFVINIFVFLIVTVFSVLLVKAIFKEVEAKDTLIRLNQAKTDFLNIASHQLRTPISVIKGVVSMMKEGDWDKLPEEKKKMFFEGLWHKSNKLESIVNDILNAAEMSNEKYKVIDKRAEWIEAKELFDKVFEESQAEAAEREIELKVILPSGELPKIYGQVEYLKEAIGNLVDNAIKYTPSTKADFDSRDTREQKGAVELGLAYDKDNAIISVKDNGIGVPQEEMSKLFAKFYRAQNARNMYTDGSGLGLFIVKEIAEGHNGRVWGKSEVGKGATFYISLPLNPQKEADVRKHIIEGESVANSQ